MSKWEWGYLYWGIWIGVLFLVPELLGNFRVLVPWLTLSETSWHAEAHWPVLRTILFGFLAGLLIHIVYRVHLPYALLMGMGVAAAAHVAHRV